jgi:predicted nuclease with TOPRIM domain
MKAENAEMKAENARNEEDIKTMKAENARNEEDIKTMKDALYSALTRIDGYIEKSK